MVDAAFSSVDKPSSVDMGMPQAPVDRSTVPPLTEQTRAEAREIVARYPRARSALLPMLHLVQSVQGYVSPDGIALCAEELELTKAEVGAVATFYTMYRRRPAAVHRVEGRDRADLGLGQLELLRAERDAIGRDVALHRLHEVQHRQQGRPGPRVTGHDLPRLRAGLLRQRRDRASVHGRLRHPHVH